MRSGVLVAVVALAGVGATTYVPWEDLTEADALYSLATRFAVVDGRRVHYPTPTAELAAALEARSDNAALRHLAEARLELGDRPGASAALASWAEAEGAEAWAEAARWGATHGDWSLAFRAAAKALPSLGGEARRALADDQVRWADRHPEAADPLALRRARAEMFPEDGAATEEWVRALEKAGRLAEAEAAAGAATALRPDRRLLLLSDLAADHGNHRRAFEILDAAIEGPEPWTAEVKQAWAERTDQGSPASPEGWRASLEGGFDPRALLRLAAYFQGQGRGDAAADLLRQVERRYEAGLDRTGWLLLARLAGEVDLVPEAFRAVLGASTRGGAADQLADLAALSDLALRAGGRPLPWGTFNEEPYRWVARIDRTPGIWTGGLSFLLTGQDWKEALARLESETLPERTFEVARALAAELARRAPAHPALPGLRLGIMRRHVDRGEGREALALFPELERGAGDVALEARRVALLAMRQTDAPLAEELRLHRSRLRALAPDGSRPRMREETYWTPNEYGEPEAGRPGRAWSRVRPEPPRERYRTALEEAISRLEQRDRSHSTSLDLLLGEMDRLPDAEDLWLYLAGRLEAWNLDDELGPRYERAIERFPGPGWWARAARWHARRARHRDLGRLAADLAARFRGAAIFARTTDHRAPEITLLAPEQPPAGTRVRLVAWADWVRLRALERFPHSPAVFAEARRRLTARSHWENESSSRDDTRVQRVIVPDALLEERRWAVLFSDPEVREEHFAEAMREGSLDARLSALEAASDRTPVEDLLLFEGWSRLSRFERASAPADRLAAAYPGDGALARRVLSLHRSLAGLDPRHAEPAAALVARTAPALADPNPLWTELGELEQEGGRPDSARRTWRRLLEREPREPARIAELATVLWDYGHMADALAVIEEGRARLARPRLLAFEAGVLREERRDVEGAVREYLAALEPESGECFCWFEREQRSLRRLSQLLARDRVRRAVLARIGSLRPGVRSDEQALASLLPLAHIDLPERDEEWTVDDWIDEMDLPRDPVGRAERAADRRSWRARARDGIAAAGSALFERALEFLPRATDPAFLDAAERWADARPAEREPDREVAFRSALLARRAELAPTEEERVERERARARYLFDVGRREAADAVWQNLAGRISALPEGAPRMRAEAERASYLERARGAGVAKEEWHRLAVRYPWSLGLLEDRLAFLARSGEGAEARSVLEAAIPRAAAGHREALLERLTREGLEAGDLAQARRAVERLLSEPGLGDDRRLGAVHLLGRLSFRPEPGFDALGLARAQSATLKGEHVPDLYAQLARAAGAEGALAAATTLWIEALNRRLERSWIGEACGAAEKAGKAGELLDFFERQQARSPRDVRWAVAVREIRLRLHDLDGAIAMAKTAVEVRPDRESLWREAADLLVRAERDREAADFLEGWHRPRPADEGAVGLRTRLYARAGDGEKALALERAALAAFAKGSRPDDARGRAVAERRGRAARRLLEYGLPHEAWRLLAGDSPFSARLAEGLTPHEEAELALASGNFLRLLRQKTSDPAFPAAAAEVLRDRGRPGQKEEVQAWLLDQIMPPLAGGPRERGSPAGLRRLWPFAVAAGLETPLRSALAQSSIAATPGPWQAEAPTAFVETVAEVILAWESRQAGDAPVLASPPLEALWVRDLVRRDRAEALEAFLQARWHALVEQVLGSGPVRADAPRVAWAAWLDDAEALGLWARAAAEKPERVKEIAGILAERRRWDRFWALAARGWNVTPLVALLPDDSRMAWFRHWQRPSPKDADPVVRARGEAVERVTVALGRLVAGRPDAVRDPVITKLRGPRTVGDVLGRDPAWTWPEFTPRRDAAGATLETGDDRIIGARADAGRLPGALWGERPGSAWFALEALARLRERDPEAPLVPLEAMARGRESERALLAARMAEALGDAALALDLDEAHTPAAPDAARLANRLRLLVDRGRRDDAGATLRAEVARRQPELDEAGFRRLRRIASDLDLGDPGELLDPATPLTAALLACLYDVTGPAPASRFRPRDPVEFRAALASRWGRREGSLSADEVRFFLSELWVNGAASLPERGLRRLGGIWPHAAAWLGRLRPADRGAGLAAVAALPDTERLEALLAREAEPRDDVARLLRIRVDLLRHDESRAKARLDEALAETDAGSALVYTVPPLPEPEEEQGEGDQFSPGPASAPIESDPVTARLLSYLAPFREAGRLDLASDRIRGALRARRERGPASAAAWRLAFELADPADREALARDIEHAWIRGDFPPEHLGGLAEALARVAPPAAGRFLARWHSPGTYDAAAQRARVLAALGDRRRAARALVEARGRGLWNAEEEVRAFDLWRSLATEASADAAGAPEAPDAWVQARAFWQKRAAELGPDLAEHLRAHPHDVRAARAALRTVAPGDEEALRLAAAVLQHTSWPGSSEAYRDVSFLRLRIARALLPRSWRAAVREAGALDEVTGLAADLRRRRLPSADVTAALADAVRLAAWSRRPDWEEPLMSAVEDRRPEEARSLRAELRDITRLQGPPPPFRLAEGRPAPYRPRDLDLAMVSAALDREHMR